MIALHFKHTVLQYLSTCSYTKSFTYKRFYYLQARKRAHLVEGLDGAEEPIFGMFRRFFPIDYFMEHMASVRQAQ